MTAIILLAMALHMGHRLLVIFKGKAFIDGQSVSFLSLPTQPENPAAIVHALAQEKVTGATFCNDYLGGAVLWSGYPAFKPIIDGRFLNQELYLAYHDVLNKPDQSWPQIEAKYGFKIIILDGQLKSSFKMARYLSRRPDWQLIMLRRSLLVFVKRGAFTVPPAWANYETELKHVILSPSDLKDLKMISQRPLPSKALFRKQYFSFIEPLEEAANLIDFLDYPGAGVKILIEAYRKIDSPEIARALKSYITIQESAASP